MANNTLSSLDYTQVIKIAFDEASGGLKTIPASGTLFAIELDAADGDTVGILGSQLNTSGNISATGATGVLIGPLSASGMRSFQLYAYSTASAGTGAVASIEYSPDGIHFLTSSISATSSLTASGVIASTLDIGHIAQSVQVKVTQLPSSGSVNFYLVMQGN